MLRASRMPAHRLVRAAAPAQAQRALARAWPQPARLQVRTAATEAKPARSRLLRFARFTIGAVGASVTTVTVLVAAFFIYDATTYKDLDDSEDLEISELALNPRRGGPKNLPVVERFLGDDDSEGSRAVANKPRLVILGSGWGAVATLKNLNADDYHITVISPINHFLFTPMLPSATVGTLEFRSLAEPIRRITASVKGHFLEAEAKRVEFSDKLVEVAQTYADGVERRFYVPYDKLVVAVGSKSNTHGVEGLENCHFLKTIEDARRIRQRVVENFERAALPSSTEEERKRLLSFVVCGGGPTGVEFAAELYDLLNEDLTSLFPKILRNQVSVHLVQSRGHILNTYDESISKYAEQRFQNDSIDVLTNARVARVEPDRVIFTQKDADGNVCTKELPYGLCLWSTGVSLCEITQSIVDSLDVQKNKHAIETDSHLRVLGAPLGDVYAIGDCSTVRTNLSDNVAQYLDTYAQKSNIPVEKLAVTFQQWRDIAHNMKRRFPQASEHLKRADQLFTKYDDDSSGSLEYAEVIKLFKDIDTKMTSLPATAQRANQQGQYIGRKLTKLARARNSLAINDIISGDIDDLVDRAFAYHHLGSLAYIGNAAVFDYNGYSFFGGLVAMYLWRSVYFAQSVSLRTRALLAMDWLTRGLFGRDITEN
ncbi:pyridine nucleotide-disulfide oxidoreductase-domain-containing protein [Dipodascopsis tothii]|uniref:pyridine nucleotide-disulfide oxidoreductase-domain-containing protein n=1 Tax=Dipodascopsis tothii TaxID=44089 RepID=UPI0034CD50FF